jgi:HTH-type transcriptional regulator/antitoxin HigA
MSLPAISGRSDKIRQAATKERRSALYRWMLANFDDFKATVAEAGRPNWKALSEALLLVLVSAYEDEHYAINPPDPIDAIVERMADRGMSRADLGELIGAPSGRVSEILNRRRPLTIDMIRKLAEGLGLSEHCLLQEYELDRLHA